MIDRSHPLPITRQAEIVNISRGSVYYENEPVSDADVKLMRCIDELHLELPFAGARMLRDLLRTEGFTVGRKHMTTLMRRMGITALYRKPNRAGRRPGTPPGRTCCARWLSRRRETQIRLGGCRLPVAPVTTSRWFRSSFAVRETNMVATWLVDADADAGIDIESIQWKWGATTVQDKRIIEDNAAGVRICAIRPACTRRWKTARPRSPKATWLMASLFDTPQGEG